MKELSGIIRVTGTFFSSLFGPDARTISRVAPCSLSGPPPESVYLPPCAVIPESRGCVPHPHGVGCTGRFGCFADAGLEPSAAPAFLPPHSFQDLECVDVDCGDKKEPELLIELFLLNKLNSRPPQNSRTRLRKGAGRKMCVSCATIFKSVPFAFFFLQYSVFKALVPI